MSLAVAALWVWVRITAVLMTAPVLASRHVPVVWRLALGAVLALAVFPLVAVKGLPEDTSRGAIIDGIVAEILIGSALGIGVMVVYASAEMVGDAIGRVANFPVDSLSGDAGSGLPTGRLFALVSSVAFVVIGGPEMLVAAVLDTFQHVPLGNMPDTQHVMATLLQLLQSSFHLALRALGPAALAIVTATTVVGIIARVVPQWDVVNAGLAVNVGMMLLAVVLTLGGCVWLFVDDVTVAIDTVVRELSQGFTP